MSTRLVNLVAGAASVRLAPIPISTHSVLEQIHARAASEGVPSEVALRRHFAERLTGQLVFTGVCLGAMALALTGVTRGWPEPLLVSCALVPALAHLGVALLHRRLQRSSLG